MLGDGRRPRIGISRRRPPGAGVARLASYGEVVEWPGDVPPTSAQLRDLVRGCDAALVFDDDVVDAAFLDAAGERLRVVAVASADFGTVDQVAARARGVVVAGTSNVLAETAADAAICLMLVSRRRLGPSIGSRRHADRPSQMDGQLDLHGARLGLVGYGPVARAVARRALGFDMSIQHYDPCEPDNIVSRAVGLDELLTTSDVVSLHMPQTPRTRGLIGARELALMKPTATLVSVSRDGVLDEAALLAALRAGTLHSAGLDVVARPPRDDAADPLPDTPNLVVLPGLGAASEAARSAMVELAARNVLAVLEGSGVITPLPGTAGRWR